MIIWANWSFYRGDRYKLIIAVSLVVWRQSDGGQYLLIEVTWVKSLFEWNDYAARCLLPFSNVQDLCETRRLSSIYVIVGLKQTNKQFLFVCLF